MLVGDRMSKPVITVRPETPMQEALNLMHKEKIRRLPVVDRNGRLVGIVTEKDLLHASPSSATSLSVWELNYLLSKITIEEVMTRQVVTVREDIPIEEAARLMVDNHAGGLPVMRGEEVVGIITETDLFKVFLELLGAREAGIRISALVRNVPGELARLTRAIYEAGGNILALGTFLGESTQNREMTLKVEGVLKDALQKAIEPVVVRVLDVRETTAA